MVWTGGKGKGKGKKGRRSTAVLTQVLVIHLFFHHCDDHCDDCDDCDDCDYDCDDCAHTGACHSSDAFAWSLWWWLWWLWWLCSHRCSPFVFQCLMIAIETNNFDSIHLKTSSQWLVAIQSRQFAVRNLCFFLLQNWFLQISHIFVLGNLRLIKLNCLV